MSLGRTYPPMKTGLYHLEGPPTQVLSQLEAARSQDLQAERKGFNFGCAAAILLLVGIVSFAASEEFKWLIPVGIVCLVACVASFVWAARAQAHNLEDERILAPLRLLQILRTDLPPDRPIRLKVDFRDYPNRDFQVARQGGLRSGQQTTYRQSWLELQARLADGGRLRLEVTRQAQRLDYWKTGGGKTRRRFKDKVQDRVALQLQVPGLDLADLVANLRPGLPLGLTGRTMQVQGDTVRMEVLTPRARRNVRLNLEAEHLATGDRLLALLAWTYQGVGRLRSRATQAG